ncbi:MAG TPA: nitrous oxide reductase family maturation protein NosD, partial [Longimicrobiales bacterium]
MRTMRQRALATVVAVVLGGGSLAAQAAPPARASSHARTLVVSKTGPLRTVTAALAAAAPGDTLVVEAGVYAEPTIRIVRPVVLLGRPGAVLDGEHQRTIMRVFAPGVVVRGLAFRNVGESYVEDRAAIRFDSARGCRIEDNRFDDAVFGIYLAATTDCVVARNVLRGRARAESSSGNGIHLWHASRIQVLDNRISGHRDGIYFEFVRASRIEGNVSEGNLRYGLHFMFSDSCRYLRNTFAHNGAGVAVMYTHHMVMDGNRFADNWGGASYGLLLKEISDSRVVHNTFLRNTVGIRAESSNRLDVRENDFLANGWALKITADCEGGVFARNNFLGNSFDVATNSSSTNDQTFDGNHWDNYRGYDLNHDGYGDAPYHPVRLFAVAVEANEAVL